MKSIKFIPFCDSRFLEAQTATRATRSTRTRKPSDPAMIRMTLLAGSNEGEGGVDDFCVLVTFAVVRTTSAAIIVGPAFKRNIL